MKKIRWNILRKHWKTIALGSFVIISGAITFGVGVGLENRAIAWIGVALLIVGIVCQIVFRHKYLRD